MTVQKIRLRFDTEEPEKVTALWDLLYQWQHICYRGANYISSHLWIQDQLKHMFYLEEGTVKKLSDIKKDPDGILQCSRKNTTYQVLSKNFKGNIPTDILTALNNYVVSYYDAERNAYWYGDKSVRNYKKSLPIPAPPKGIRNIKYNESIKNFTFNFYSIPFQTYFGAGHQGPKETWNKFIEGTLTLNHATKVMIKENKIYLLAAFELAQEQYSLDKNIIAQAELGFDVPIEATAVGKTVQIGTNEDFIFKRLAIQRARSRHQKASKQNRSKNGLKRQKKNSLNYGDREKRYIQTKVHQYSRQLVDFCLKHRAATLLLTKQAFDEVEDKKYQIPNWTFGGLIEKIKYKTARLGITLIEE